MKYYITIPTLLFHKSVCVGEALLPLIWYEVRRLASDSILISCRDAMLSDELNRPPSPIYATAHVPVTLCDSFLVSILLLEYFGKMHHNA
jgi:hypothetical protein